MFELYLVRHAPAAERGPAYPDDRQRPLTPDGEARMAEIAAGIAALGVELDEILTSPFVRTRQTAEILARAWNPPPKVTDLSALATDGRPADVFAALAKRSARRRVALVGHMPGIGELAAALLGLPEALDFKKGAVCCVEIDALPPRRRGRLQWFAPPRMLRRLGKA